MKKSTVRILAIVLVALMCLSLLPLAAANAEEFELPPEIPGFTLVGDQYVENGHAYGEIVNEDFLVNQEERGDCETPAVYWKSCVNINPYTQERCGITAEHDWNEAMNRLKTELSQRRANGEKADYESIFVNAITELDYKYKFSYGGFGHQWVEVDYQPATCEQDGWDSYYYCSVCGEGLDYIPVIPATGHRYEEGICVICGKADPDYVPVASSDDAALALSDSASFDSDEIIEELVEGNDIPAENLSEGGNTLLSNNNEPNNDNIIGNSGEIPVPNADSISITFDGNGADGGSMSTQDIPSDHSVPLNANAFTRTNYTFTGWNTAADGSGVSFTDGWSVTAGDFTLYPDHILYAQWQRISVTFSPNGGNGSVFTQDLDTAPNPLTANPFTRPGYRFIGWDTDVGGNGQHFTDQESVSTDENNTSATYIGAPVTLYAQWQKKIDIVYQSNGGVKKSYTEPHYAGETVTIKDLDATGIPIKNQRTFSGEWNTDPKGGETGDVYLPGSTIPLTNDTSTPITLYAQWNFTVNFDANNGTGSMDPITDAREYRELALPANTEIMREGYIFDGWNTQSNGKGTSYEDAATIPAEEMSGPFTLYAQWVEEYKITFKGNNATSGTMEPVGGIKDENVDLPTNEFKRDGYSFIGWNTKEDGTGTSYEDGATVTITDNMDLYAQWEQVFSVTFDENSGSGTAPEAISVKNGGTATLPTNTLTRVGYEPNGWNTTADGTGTHYDDGATISNVTEDIPLYAEWDKLYTVVFNRYISDSDTTTEEQSIRKSEISTATLTPFTELNFSNTGKVFEGWSKTKGGSLDFEDQDSIQESDFTSGTLNLYARWKDFATVTFDKNNTAATGTMDPMKVTDEAKPLTANAFTREGYRFMGWNTDKNGDGTAFEDKESVDTSVITADVTLYAQWSRIFKIQYQSHGGSGIMPNQEALSGVELEIAANGFTKTGADFDSWNTKADGSGTTYKAGDKHTFKETDSDLTLYAQWTYTVTFDPNGGTGYIVEGNTDKALEKQAYEIPENTDGAEEPTQLITRTGYAFVSWNTKADGTGDKYTDGGTIPASKVTGPITLYAQWDQEYTVSFKNTADATQTMEPQIILKSVLDKAGTTGVALNANEFTRDDYVFTGWNTNDAGTGDHFDDEGKVKATDFDSYATLTLYAQWEEEAVITFHRNYDTTLADKTQSVPEKTDAKLNTNTYARQGYVFDAWYTSPSGTGDRYEDGGTIPADKVEGDIELYAKWIGPVKISGSSSEKESYGYVGETLTCSIAPTEKISLQWVYKDAFTDTSWKKISGQTSQTFTPTSAYTGKYIACAAVTENAEGEEKNILSINNKQITNTLTGVSLKQDIIDIVNEKAASSYAQPGQIQGVTKNMEYTTNGGSTWSSVTNLSSAGVMSVLKPGTYKFRIKGTSIESDPITVTRWFTLSYTTSNTTSTSTTGSGGTTSSTGSGTVQLRWNGTSMPTNTSPDTRSPNVVKYSGGTNMWLVREGADDVITMIIRPSSGSYGHWNINGGSYANVSTESTITVTPLKGPEHYNIIFNRSSSSPRTADESHLGLWSALCLISLTGAATILGKTYKRKKTS